MRKVTSASDTTRCTLSLLKAHRHYPRVRENMQAASARYRNSGTGENSRQNFYNHQAEKEIKNSFFHVVSLFC